MLRKILVIVLIISAMPAFARKEGYNWYFPQYYGLTFKNYVARAQPVYNGKIGSQHGFSSVISDSLGNIVLYTDNGEHIWNRFHKEVYDCAGTNIKLFEDESFIIKKPGSDKIYYVFCFDYTPSPLCKLVCRTVDVSMYGGQGCITATDYIIDNVVVDLGAGFHKNNKDVWLIAHGIENNNYYAFLIDENGLNKTPVVSSVGTTMHTLTSNPGDVERILRVSPDRKKLGYVINPTNQQWETYDFDSQTGKITNALGYIGGQTGYAAQGFEFSRKSRFFYADGYQYDMAKWDTIPHKDSTYDVTIPGWKYSVTYSYYYKKRDIPYLDPLKTEAFRCGPDGKIYIIGALKKNNNNRQIFVMNKPDLPCPACDLDTNYIVFDSVPGAKLGHTFPNFLISDMDIKPEGNDPLCIGDQLQLKSNASYDIGVSYQWSGPAGFNSTDANPVIDSVDAARGGRYYLTCHFMGEDYSDSVDITIRRKPQFGFKVTGPTMLCPKDTAILDVATEPGVIYKWSDGSTVSRKYVTKPGKFIITVNDPRYCPVSDTIDITSAAISPDLLTDGNPPFCSGDSVKVYLGTKYTRYRWSTGDTTEFIYVKKNGTYTVLVDNSRGCHAQSNPLDIAFSTSPSYELRGANVVCLNDTSTYKIFGAGTKYSLRWSADSAKIITSDTLTDVKVVWQKAGKAKIILYAMNRNCLAQKQIDVIVGDPPAPQISPANAVICNSTPLLLTAPAGYASYLWSNGDTAQSISVTQGGDYTVTVTDSNGCKGSSNVCHAVQVNFPDPAITGPKSMCKGDRIQLTLNNSYKSYLWSTGETAPSITVSAGGTYTVTVSDSNACTGTAQTDIAEASADMKGIGNLQMNSKDTTISITNISGGDLQINRIYLKSGKNMKISTLAEPPLMLGDGWNMDIRLISSRKTGSNETDTIVIEINYPCQKTYEMAVMSDKCSVIHLTAGTVSAEPGTELCIPVYARLEGISDTSFYCEYEIKYAVNYKAFLPKGKFRISGDQTSSVLTGSARLSTSQSKIASICGMTLLTDRIDNPISITDMKFSASAVCDTVSEGGLLTLEGCGIKFQREILLQPTELYVVPNLSANELNIKALSQEGGTHRITILNSIGQELKTYTWDNAEGNVANWQETLEAGDYGSGVYYAILQTHTKYITRKFIVLK